MQKNSILVISNNLSTGKYIADKVKLLRQYDTVKIVSFIESVTILHTNPPSLILLYCENINSVEIVKAIRTMKVLDKVPIIFITDEYDEELILTAFDSGIDDFFSLDNPDSVILMRIFLTLQKSVLYQKSETDSEIMVAAGITDKETGLYTKKQVSLIMKIFFNKAIKENSDNTFFMAMKLLSKKDEKIDFKDAGISIKKTLRGNDIIAFGKDDVFYILLNKTKPEGPESVYARLKYNLGDNYELYSVSTQIKFDFEKTESILSGIMVDLIMNKGAFRFVTPDEIKEAIKQQSGKKTKRTAKNTLDNIKNMIAPAFERTKKFVNSEYKSAKVTFEIGDNQSIFKMKKGTYETEIIVSYPSLTKIISDIIHKDRVKMPSSKKLVYKTNELNEDKLYEIFSENISLQWG